LPIVPVGVYWCICILVYLYIRERFF
jgi:hypothetical protein